VVPLLHVRLGQFAILGGKSFKLTNYLRRPAPVTKWPTLRPCSGQKRMEQQKQYASQHVGAVRKRKDTDIEQEREGATRQ
jgi:hypothetical protein